MYLGRKLGRTVPELRASMTQEEFIAQVVYDLRKTQREELARAKAGR